MSAESPLPRQEDDWFGQAKAFCQVGCCLVSHTSHTSNVVCSEMDITSKEISRKPGLLPRRTQTQCRQVSPAARTWWSK